MRALLFILLVCCTSVFAQEVCKEYSAYYGSKQYPWVRTAAAACSSVNGSEDGMAIWDMAPHPTIATLCVGKGQLTFNGVPGQVNEISARLDSRTKPGPCAGECDATVGEIATINVTRGWSRSPLPNKTDQFGATAAVPKHVCAPPPGGSAGAGQCKWSVLGNEEAFRSQTPSQNGLYRLSSDVSAIQVEGACDAATDSTSANPETPDKPCPGTLGELNGKPFCAVDPGQSGVEPVGPPAPPGSTDDKGNPRAGPKPESGEGSGTGGVGRTPGAGNGGNAGGPGSAANGGNGTKPGDKPNDGTTDKPEDGKEQAACGAPGQPKCRIDETGTPDGKNAYDDAKKQLDDADKSRKEALDKISDTSDKNTSWGQSFGWVQHGGCQPWNLGTIPLGAGIPLTVDICPILPYIEWVTSFLWALVTFALTIGMVFRVTTASSS